MRRRLMGGGKPVENYIIATYNVTIATSATRLLGSSFDSTQIQAMYIENQNEVVATSNGFNGQQIDISYTYTFSTTGEHRIKICFNDKLTSLLGLFGYCSSLTSLDLLNFDTSNVTNMTRMFSCCTSLTSLDLSNFNTSKVTKMVYMFEELMSLTSLDVSNFDTSNVTNTAGMFYGCSSLTSLDLSNFNTSNVTSISTMFANCKQLTSINISNFDTSKVTYLDNMFFYCTKLTSATMLGDVSSVTIYNDMFYNITTTGVFFYNSEYDYSLILANIPSTWTSIGTTEDIMTKKTTDTVKIYNYAFSLGAAYDTVEFPISIKVGDFFCKKAYLSDTEEVVFMDDNTGKYAHFLHKTGGFIQ